MACFRKDLFSFYMFVFFNFCSFPVFFIFGLASIKVGGSVHMSLDLVFVYKYVLINRKGTHKVYLSLIISYKWQGSRKFRFYFLCARA